MGVKSDKVRVGAGPLLQPPPPGSQRASCDVFIPDSVKMEARGPGEFGDRTHPLGREGSGAGSRRPGGCNEASRGPREGPQGLPGLTQGPKSRQSADLLWREARAACTERESGRAERGKTREARGGRKGGSERERERGPGQKGARRRGQ